MDCGLMSSKVYFRCLALFTAVLGISQIGWLIYFSTPPARPNRRTETRRLTFPQFSSPTFKYRYRVERASGFGWQEVEITETTARKLLALLRGAELSVVKQEASSEHPGSLVQFNYPLPDSLARLSAYEDGSETPSLSIDLMGHYLVMVSQPDRQADVFFLSPVKAKGIKDTMDDIQWGPVPKDEL